MTIASLCNDMMILAIFMILGFFIRSKVKLFKILYLPASLIGGLLLLVLGPQLANIVSIPSSFSELPSELINIILASIVFGVNIDRDKIDSYLDYSCVTMTAYGTQMCVGVGLGALLGNIWKGLPVGWGVMGVFAFHGGHGTATAAAASFEKLGIKGNMSVGMVLSTFGLIIAMAIGMIVVNIGIRKGWASYITAEEAKSLNKKLDNNSVKGKSIGSMVVDSISINHLALQCSWLLAAVFIGNVLFDFVGGYSQFVADLPGVLRGIFGGLILWECLKLTKLDKYVDLKTIKMISGFLLDIVILTAIATLNLVFMTTYIVPVLIYTIILTILTVLIVFGLSKVFIKHEWFEKACMAFGAATGTTSTGLALVRVVDPDSKCSAGDTHGVYSAIMSWKDIFTGLAPVWLVSGVGLTMGVGAMVAIGFFAIGVLICRRVKSR